MPRITQKQKKLAQAHFCNCPFCDKKSVCLVCKTPDNLHRAHIIPRSLIGCIREESSQKEEMLSFTGSNVFALCDMHHREYDNFSLKEREILRPYIHNKIIDFIVFTDDKTLREGDKKKFDRWTQKMNKWLFDGREAITWDYVLETHQWLH